MDENYLDDLLNGVSSGGKMNKNIDSAVDMDAGIDIDMSDLDDISLDELDDLDNLDLGDLDIDDIDFDDLDITNLNAKKQQTSQEDDDFDLEDLLKATESNQVSEESVPVDMSMPSMTEESEDLQQPDIMSMASSSAMADQLDEADELAMSDLFSALGVVDEATQEDTSNEVNFDFMEKEMDVSNNEPKNDLSSVDEFDLDDLFSALGIEDEEKSEGSAYTSGEAELDDLFKATAEMSLEGGDLDDILDLDDLDSKKPSKKKKGPKKKKTLSEIVFGEPDEDDLEEERLYQEKKAKKAALKEEKANQKSEMKVVKDAAKKEKDDKKKREDHAKLEAKKVKKAKKEAELRAELEAEKNSKKVSTPVVIIVFTIFIALAILVVVGTKSFNYSQVIKKAADYFDRQRYRLAYDEVSGVEVKEEDEKLRDRIYTVMYVERLYESYENNISLGRYDMALDALLRGLEKYDVHYQEAVELDIVEDIDSCRAKIVDALASVYGITEVMAYDIMTLEGQEYSSKLEEYSQGMGTGE